MSEVAFWGLVAAALVNLAVLVRLLRQLAALGADREVTRLERPESLDDYPSVTVIVPMRNESRNARGCLEHLLRLDYPNVEILIADDESTDDTTDIIRAVARENPGSTVRLLETPNSPAEREDWASGKSFVLWHASKQATNDWLLFVDADVRLEPDSLWRAQTFARDHDLRAVSAAGGYENPHFLGKVAEGLLITVLFTGMPIRRINRPEAKRDSWMAGIFVLMQRSAYEQLGGHKAVRRFAMEDLALARLTKLAGVPYRYLPATQLYNCSNYIGLKDAFRGWIRVLAGITPWLRYGRWYYAAVFVGLLLTTVLPYVVVPLLAIGALDGISLGGVSLSALAWSQIAVSQIIFAPTLASMGIAWWRALLLPIAAPFALLAVLAAYRARYHTGEFEFRGRRLSPDVVPDSVSLA